MIYVQSWKNIEAPHRKLSNVDPIVNKNQWTVYGLIKYMVFIRIFYYKNITEWHDVKAIFYKKCNNTSLDLYVHFVFWGNDTKIDVLYDIFLYLTYNEFSLVNEIKFQII